MTKKEVLHQILAITPGKLRNIFGYLIISNEIHIQSKTKIQRREIISPILIQ